MRRLLAPRLVLLALAHFSIDAYSSFVSPLLPLLVTKLDLTLTRVGTLIALSSLSSSLSQPLFGLLADRVRRPWFVAFGPLCAAVFLSAVGLASSFGGLVALLMLGGLGAAAFHPQGAALATDLAERRTLALSLFVSGGTFGFSLGPLFAVSVVSGWGLDRSWVAAVPGLMVSGLLLAWFSRVSPRVRRDGPRPAVAELRPMLRPLTLLYFAVVCRSAVSFGFMTFLPIVLHRRGVSIGAGGALLTAYLGLGALGGFLGGWLADRWGGRRVVVASFLGSAPLYSGFLFLPDVLGLLSLVLGSFVLQASLPVNVVLGQELSPRHSSTISSLLMGAAWGVGALLVGPVGALADARGLPTALGCLVGLLGVGFGCALALPAARRTPLPVDLVQPSMAAEGS
jgi:FSR family fosmidomycin resistance protein-like MFS transporter